MSVEQTEKNRVKFTFHISPEQFEEGMNYAYNKNKNQLSVQGFRKGKASRKVIEMRYGKDIFFEEALNYCIPKTYSDKVDELKLEPVCDPDISVLSVSVESGADIQAEVYVKPEVIINEYKGITYHLGDIVIPGSDDESIEEEVNKQLEAARDKNARLISVTDRAVAFNDIATIDFKGSVDGEYFDGGEGKDYDLAIGSKTFIDNFEDQIVGHNVGDSFVVNVTFPEDYNAEKLAGKPAQFEVTVKEIKVKEIPNLDDDFAADVSEFDTLEEYKASIRDGIKERNAQQYDRMKENLIMQNLFKKAEVDIPQVMIEMQARLMMNEFNRNLQQQGMSLEMLMKYSGQTFDDFKKSYLARAEVYVRSGLVLEAVAKNEGIIPTDEDFSARIDEIVAEYKFEKEAFLNGLSEDDKASIKAEIANKKAYDLVLEHSVALEGKSEPEAENKEENSNE